MPVTQWIKRIGRKVQSNTDSGHEGDDRTLAVTDPIDVNSPPPHVVCIDDDRDFCRAIKLRLEAHGIAVLCAHDGREGYEIAATQHADAIILDYGLPNGRGDSVLKRLKESPNTQDIPVLVVTGYRDAKLERTMLELGANQHMTKPLVFQELLKQLRYHLDVLPKAALAVPRPPHSLIDAPA